MYSKEESLKQLEKPVKNKAGKVITKKGKPVYKTVLVPDFDKHETFTLKLEEKGKVTPTQVHVRKSKPAKQVINITEEAYHYMISKEAPAEYKGAPWNALTINQKLKWHCSRTAEQVGGMMESFEVLD